MRDRRSGLAAYEYEKRGAKDSGLVMVSNNLTLLQTFLVIQHREAVLRGGRDNARLDVKLSALIQIKLC